MLAKVRIIVDIEGADCYSCLIAIAVHASVLCQYCIKELLTCWWHWISSC